MCCGPNDICLNNGLCKVKQSQEEEDSGAVATYWRDTCSSYPWPEVGCLKDICTVCDCQELVALIDPSLQLTLASLE